MRDPQTIETLANLLGCSPEMVGKTLLKKTQHTSVASSKESMLEVSWKLPCSDELSKCWKVLCKMQKKWKHELWPIQSHTAAWRRGSTVVGVSNSRWFFFFFFFFSRWFYWKPVSMGKNSFLALKAQLTAHAWEGHMAKWEATTVVELSWHSTKLPSEDFCLYP